MSRATVEAEPDRAAALMRAVWRAARWLGDPANAMTAAELAGGAAYLDVSPEILERTLAGRLVVDGHGREVRVPRAIDFFTGAASFPWRSQALWIAEALARSTGADRGAAAGCGAGVVPRRPLPFGARAGRRRPARGFGEARGRNGDADGGRLHARTPDARARPLLRRTGFRPDRRRLRRLRCSNRSRTAPLPAARLCTCEINRAAERICCCGAARLAHSLGHRLNGEPVRVSRPEAGATQAKPPDPVPSARDRRLFLFPRRVSVVETPRASRPRTAMRHRLAGTALALLASAASAEMLPVEKDELTLGFIKLTDMAPLAIAYEKHFFEDEGLYVRLEAQANWKVLLDRVISGELDGAHMLAGQPLASTVGYGTRAHIVTPLSMDLNGNAITVSNAVWERMKPGIPTGADGKPMHPISAAALRPAIDAANAEGKRLQHGHGLPGLDPQLRAALLARRRRAQPRVLRVGRREGPDRRRRAALGHAAAADAGDAGGGHDRRLLGRRAVEPGRGVQGHRPARRHRRARSSRTTRRRSSALPRTSWRRTRTPRSRSPRR